MAQFAQNNAHRKDRVPPYYNQNRVYTNGSHARTNWPTRTSRRVHDNLVLSRNYGLDTVSDDLNSSPYSSPFYINGRYNSDALPLQRGNSASVQGTEFLLDVYSTAEDFSEDDIQTSIEMWQGKQIKFSLPYRGKVVAHTISLKNTDACQGILSIYFSTTDGGTPIAETAVDLCTVSQDKFEHFTLRPMLPILAKANPKGRLYIRMEIWDEVDQGCSRNPFNTGRKIEVAANGAGTHEAAACVLGERNVPVNEKYEYKNYANKPLIGFVYNSYTSVPVERIDQEKNGAAVSLNGYKYDLFCIKDGAHAEMLVYDRAMNKIVEDTDIRIDGRVERLNISQCTDTNQQTWVYYVDGHSPLQRFKIGEWESESFPASTSKNVRVSVDENIWWDTDLGQASGYYEFIFAEGSWHYDNNTVSLSDYGISLSGVPAEGARIYIGTSVGDVERTLESVGYVDTRPVVGASLIMFHNNRLYLTGFEQDPNLVQVTEITEDGPSFTSFPYRFYSPNRSPYDTSANPITAILEYATDQIMILGKNFYTIYQTYASTSTTGLEDGYPAQVSTYTDSAGVLSQGDVTNYKGTIYSFDQKEGIRRYTGATWRVLENAVDSHFDRVDMTKPRKLWGYANKLYFNYTDKVDGKAKCLIWDMFMNYQSYPWFQDADIPFCDVRYDEDAELIGIHPDYPCIMKLYAKNVWRRLDTPITFRRDTKFISVPGGNHDMRVQRIHNKIIADANRWVWFGINFDKHTLEQHRGKDVTYRFPTWDTIDDEEPTENIFAVEDIYEENAISRLTIPNINIRCSAVQVRTLCKTFRAQFNLVSTGFEITPVQYL